MLVCSELVAGMLPFDDLATVFEMMAFSAGVSLSANLVLGKGIVLLVRLLDDNTGARVDAAVRYTVCI